MSENVRITKEESEAMKASTRAFIDAVGNKGYTNSEKIIVTYSPYAKVFNPCEKVEKYIDNLNLLKDCKDDIITIPRAEGAFVFKVGTPYEVKTGVAEWLVGLNNELTNKENDWTGFVYLDIPSDLLSAYKYMLQGKKIDKEDADIITKKIEYAKQLSISRSLKFIKDLYNSFMLGRQKIKTEFNIDPGLPNDTELLLSFILKEEIKMKNEKRASLMAEFNEANKIIGGSIL